MKISTSFRLFLDRWKSLGVIGIRTEDIAVRVVQMIVKDFLFETQSPSD